MVSRVEDQPLRLVGILLLIGAVLTLVGYFWFSLVAALATFIGLILLGLATARAGTFPSAPGYLLTIAGVLAIPLAFVSISSIIALIPLMR